MHFASRVRWLLLLTSCAVALRAPAAVNVPHSVVFDQPGFSVLSDWRGSTLGIPGRLGGIAFSPNGSLLFVVGNAGTASNGIWALAAVRDPATKRVTNLVGPAVPIFTGTFSSLDAGLAYGPGGSFFHTYLTPLAFGAPRWFAYRPGGIGGAEVLRDLSAFPQFGTRGLGGLTFNPQRADPQTGFGRMLVNDGVSEDLIEVDLAPDGAGGWMPSATRTFVHVETRTNQGGLGQVQFLPAPFQGDLMYVSYTDGELRIIEIDPATGIPFVEPSCTPTCRPQLGTLNPIDVRFAHGFGEANEVSFNAGPLGLEVDRLSNDLFVTTSDGVPANVIFQIVGFSSTASTTTTLPTSTTSTSTTSSTSSSTTTSTSSSTSSSTSTSRTTSSTTSTSTSSSTSSSSSLPAATTSTSTTTTSTTRQTTTSTMITTTSTTSSTTTSSVPATTSTSTSVSSTTTTSVVGTSTSTTVPSLACGGTPLGGCVAVDAALVSLEEGVPGFERLRIVLKRPRTALGVAELGDPVDGTTRYDLCLYDDAAHVVLGVSVDRAGELCGGRPCWARRTANGYRYVDRGGSADGVVRALLRGGSAGRGRIVFKAGNHAGRGQVDFPAGAAAGLAGSDGVTVQVVASDGACVGGTLRDVSRADGMTFKASGETGP